jgi:hypothetical protein
MNLIANAYLAGYMHKQAEGELYGTHPDLAAKKREIADRRDKHMNKAFWHKNWAPTKPVPRPQSWDPGTYHDAQDAVGTEYGAHPALAAAKKKIGDSRDEHFARSFPDRRWTAGGKYPRTWDKGDNSISSAAAYAKGLTNGSPRKAFAQ